MLISSGNTLKDIPRKMFDQIFRYPVTQSSVHINEPSWIEYVLVGAGTSGIATAGAWSFLICIRHAVSMREVLLDCCHP